MSVVLLLAVAVQTAPLDDLVARARAGTERFKNPDSARAAGYRPVGPDFPGMGRHWVHPGLILRDSIDPGQPPVLEYADIGGRSTLVGVAYAVLVKNGMAPAQLPVPAHAWHYHQGTVAEESFIRSHVAPDHNSPPLGPSIAVLHAWIWVENPDGILATDNWALPYARLGYARPPTPSRAAARALALASGESGQAYLDALLRAVGQPNDGEAAALSQIVARHQRASRAAGSSREALEACWRALWVDVRQVVRPEVWTRLAMVQ